MSFEIALTGLNAASTELEVISNNIANNATTGFKRTRADFADVYASSSLGSANNAVGQGVRVGSLRQEFTQGDVRFTQNNLDLAVDGTGMFELNDNGNVVYTRAGAFNLDREGFIVNPQGHRLTGYGIDADNEIVPITGDLQVDFADIEPRESDDLGFVLNLDSRDEVLPAFDPNVRSTYNYTTSTTVYDALGSAQIATLYLHKDTPTSWSSFLFVDGQEVTQPGGEEMTFDGSGNLTAVNGDPAGTFTTSTFNPASGATQMDMTVDLSDVTHFEALSGVNQIVQDGYASGRLEDFDIDASGIVFGRYSNGQAKTMGQITLTEFPNEEGLQQLGNSSWGETFSSGEPATGAPGSASLGLVQAGALENSNVDITQELVAMIGAQRSFQANAQVISTGDTLTQTVINIRR
jgi:flagellar hook protein FlgE